MSNTPVSPRLKAFYSCLIFPFMVIFSLITIGVLWLIDAYWTLMDNPWTAGLLMALAFAAGWFFQGWQIG